MIYGRTGTEQWGKGMTGGKSAKSADFAVGVEDVNERVAGKRGGAGGKGP